MSSVRLHVVGAVLARRKECLLGRRLPGGVHGGCWEFPGGKVERGETAEQALQRELREELGLCVRVGPFLARSETRIQGQIIVLDVHLVPVLDELAQPVSRDHQALQWFSGDDLACLMHDEAPAPLARPDWPAARVLLKRWKEEGSRR